MFPLEIGTETQLTETQLIQLYGCTNRGKNSTLREVSVNVTAVPCAVFRLTCFKRDRDREKICMRVVMKERLDAIWPWEEKILGE